MSEHLKEICKRYHVEIMYVYGSRGQEVAGYVAGIGRMDMHSLSDVDIGVKFLKSGHVFTNVFNPRSDPPNE